MSRDPEADRYELQAERERHEELGQALYEKRRPDAPKAWAELDQAARTQWILIAIDQQGAVDTRRQREIAEQALAIARAETGLPDPLAEQDKQTDVTFTPLRADPWGHWVFFRCDRCGATVGGFPEKGGNFSDDGKKLHEQWHRHYEKRSTQ